MPVQEPKWVTPALINWMIDLCKRNQSRQDYLANAKEFRAWYKGDRFLAPVEGHDDVAIDDRNAVARRNIIGETVDELGSVLLKNNPIIRRRPYLPWHIDLSDDLDALWLWQWLECNGQGCFRSIMEDAQLTGLATLKVIWNPIINYPGRKGVIRLIPQPEGAVLVDPNSSNTQRGNDARFIIHHVRKLPQELIAKFGKKAAMALGYHSGSGPLRNWNFATDMLAMSNVELTKPLSGPRQPIASSYMTSGMNTTGSPPAVDPLEGAKKDVYEAWIFPQTMYSNELIMGEQVEPEYKYGIVATMCENQILDIKPNPLFARKRLKVQDETGMEVTKVLEVGPRRHPFVFLWWNREADENGNRKFYDCRGMVEWMVPVQFNYNAIRRNIAIIARTIANPALAYNKDYINIDPAKIKFIPGQMIPVEGVAGNLDNAIKPLYPGNIPPDLFNMIAIDQQAIKEIGGIRPGLTGIFPEGGGTSHTPAATIGTIQEASFGPLWVYVDELDDALVDLSTVMDGLIQLKYQPGHYMVASRRGRAFWLEWSGEHAAAQFQRHVVAGATTPVYDLEKEQRQAFVMEKTQVAIMSGDPRMVRLALIYLRSLYNFPWAHQYEQELQAELMRLEQMTQGLQQVGAQDMAGRMQGFAGQQALPAAGGGTGEIDEEGVNILLQRMGATPEQVFQTTGS